MAVTLGQMTARILRESNRDDSFEVAVEDCIVTAIKELEREQFWLFEKSTVLNLLANDNAVDLPEDFCEVKNLRLLVGNCFFNQHTGFVPVTFNDLRDWERTQGLIGIPNQWALFANQIILAPYASDDYDLYLDYYYKDEDYPINYDDTSIWLGDLTADVTRYKALTNFYRDELQAEEKAMYYEARADSALTSLRIRNNQRKTINRLSI